MSRERMSASEPLGQEQAQEQELTLASHSAVQDVSEITQRNKGAIENLAQEVSKFKV